MVCAALRGSYDMVGYLEPPFIPSYVTVQHNWQVFLRNRDQFDATVTYTSVICHVRGQARMARKGRKQHSVCKAMPHNA